MATYEVTFTHPQLTISEQLTVTDAKLIEFADLLIEDYGPDENGDPLTRQAAVTRFALGVIQAAKDAYRRMSYNQDVEAIVEEEIDA